MQFSSILMLVAMLAQSAQPPQANEPTPPSLKTQLESYFRTSKAADRAQLAAEIAEGFGFQEIVTELPRLDLWTKIPNMGEWSLPTPSGQTIQAVFSIPLEYNPSQALPLIVVLPKTEESPSKALARLTVLVGGQGYSHAWVVLDKPVGGSFQQPIQALGGLPDVLREIRRHIHVDMDRVYLLGENGGADAAWMAAIMYPNPFAGVIALSGFPRLPYPEQAYAILLPNLRGTPFLSIWTDDRSAQSPVSSINKAIANFALAAGLHFDTATLAPNQSGEVSIPMQVIASATSKTRQPKPGFELWFRYLPQGNVGWLRATDLAGDVWDDEQISIAVTAKEDRDDFITQTLKEKLFFLNGEIAGQTITIETKRIGGVELRLSPEQVDFTKPVTIVINGRPRFEGMLEPSIMDLLESAYEDWDFQHPVYVRKSFSINAK